MNGMISNLWVPVPIKTTTTEKMNTGVTQENHQSHIEGIRKSKSILNTTTQDMLKNIETAREKTIEDMKKIGREGGVQVQGDIEEETIVLERKVIVEDQQDHQETEDTETEDTALKAVMREGGMLAMGNEKSAQRPLVMGGL